MSEAITELSNIRLIPARVDLSTRKTQLAISAVSVAVAAVAAFWMTVTLGFIADDFAVLHAVASAAEGGIPAFFLSMNNPAVTNLGYGPLAFASLLLDYFFFHVQAAPYHMENLALYMLCAVLVGLIAAQISERYASRLASAAMVWAGLLYAVFPLHAEVVSWVAGRADLLGEIFFLSTIFCYLRFRAIRERAYLTLALISFTLALLTKVQAISLPAIITLAELLVFAGDKMPWSRRALFPVAFWIILFFISMIAIAFPWLLPFSSASSTLSDSWAMAHNQATWQSLLGTHAAGSGLLLILYATYASSSLLLVPRVIRGSLSWRLLVWSLLWVVLSLVADPNLSAGESGLARLLFFSSAPLCITVVMLCLPVIDAIGRTWAMRLTIIGIIPLIIIFGAFLSLLEQAHQSWNTRSAETTSITHAIEAGAQKLHKGEGMLITGLPSELSGDRVRFAFSEPFSDLGRKIQTLPPEVLSGSSIWPEQVLSAIKATDCSAILRWDSQSGPIAAWTKPKGADQYSIDFDERLLPLLTCEPPNAGASAAARKEPYAVAQAKSIRIYAGAKSLTLWLPAVEINPLKADVAQLSLVFTGDKPACRHCPQNNLKLVWEAATAVNGKHQAGSASIVHQNAGQYLIWLGRYPNWTLTKSVTRIGLQFQPGNYYADLSSLALVPHLATMPQLNLRVGGRLLSSSALPVQMTPSNSPMLDFDVSHVPGARGTRIYIWDDKAQFSASSEDNLYDLDSSNGVAPVFHSDFIIRSDTLTLSPQLFGNAGAYYARALALDKSDTPYGLPTEPLAFGFKRK